MMAETKNTACSAICLFIGDIHPNMKKKTVQEALSQYGCIKKLQLKFNKQKRSKMCFFSVEGYSVIKAFLIRPVFLRGVEHYCQISQKFDHEEKPKEFDFQKRCVFINNIPKLVDDGLLANFFSQYGNVESAFSIKKYKKNVGYGFVYFKEIEATNEVLNIKKISFKGKTMVAKRPKFKDKDKKKLSHDNISFKGSSSARKEKGAHMRFEPQTKQGFTAEIPNQVDRRESLHWNRKPPGDNKILIRRDSKKLNQVQNVYPYPQNVYNFKKRRRVCPFYKPFDFELKNPFVGVVGKSQLTPFISENHVEWNLRMNWEKQEEMIFEINMINNDEVNPDNMMRDNKIHWKY